MDITPELLAILLPFGCALTLACRAFLGVTAIGIFAPTLLALNVMQLGARNTLAMLLVAAGSAFVVMPLLDRLALPKASRLAVQVGVVVTALLATGILTDQNSAAPVVVLAIVLERAWDTLHVEGLLTGARLVATTVVLAFFVAAVLAAISPALQAQAWYLTALAGILINALIGSYRGLRLSELRRFRTVIRADRPAAAHAKIMRGAEA